MTKLPVLHDELLHFGTSRILVVIYIYTTNILCTIYAIAPFLVQFQKKADPKASTINNYVRPAPSPLKIAGNPSSGHD